MKNARHTKEVFVLFIAISMFTGCANLQVPGSNFYYTEESDDEWSGSNTNVQWNNYSDSPMTATAYSYAFNLSLHESEGKNTIFVSLQKGDRSPWSFKEEDLDVRYDGNETTLMFVGERRYMVNNIFIHLATYQIDERMIKKLVSADEVLVRAISTDGTHTVNLNERVFDRWEDFLADNDVEI